MRKTILFIFSAFSLFAINYPDAGPDARKKCFADHGAAIPADDFGIVFDAVKTGKLPILKCVHEAGGKLDVEMMVLMNRTLTHDGKWEAGPQKEGNVSPIEIAIQNSYLDMVEYIMTRGNGAWVYNSDANWQREKTLDLAYKYKNDQAKILIRKLIQKDIEKWYPGKRIVMYYFSDIPLSERASICRTDKKYASCLDFPGFMTYALDSK